MVQWTGDSCTKPLITSGTTSASDLSDQNICRTYCGDCCDFYRIVVTGGSSFDGVYVFRREGTKCKWSSENHVLNIVGTKWQIVFMSDTSVLAWHANNCTICPPLDSKDWTQIQTNASGSPSFTIDNTLCHNDGDVSSTTSEGSRTSSSSNAGPQFTCSFDGTAAGVDNGYNE